MDTRTGNIYPDMETAKALGVPDDRLVPVDVANGTITIANGPFKGRIYDVAGGKRGRRRKDLEAIKQKADELEARLVELSKV